MATYRERGRRIYFREVAAISVGPETYLAYAMVCVHHMCVSSAHSSTPIRVTKQSELTDTQPLGRLWSSRLFPMWPTPTGTPLSARHLMLTCDLRLRCMFAFNCHVCGACLPSTVKQKTRVLDPDEGTQMLCMLSVRKVILFSHINKVSIY